MASKQSAPEGRITENLLRRRAEHNEGVLATLKEVTLHQQEIKKIEVVNQLCKELQILYLQNNLIEKIENVYRLKDLRYLNLAVNNVRRIENLDRCESLEKLDLTCNMVDDLLSVENLRENEFMRELHLLGNPCTKYEDYRDFVIATLPGLKNLDGREIVPSQRIVAAQRLASIRAGVAREQEAYIKSRKERESREEAESASKPAASANQADAAAGAGEVAPQKDGTAADHTYDRGYKKWEKFDVEAALDEDSAPSATAGTATAGTGHTATQEGGANEGSEGRRKAEGVQRSHDTERGGGDQPSEKRSYFKDESGIGAEPHTAEGRTRTYEHFRQKREEAQDSAKAAEENSLKHKDLQDALSSEKKAEAVRKQAAVTEDGGVAAFGRVLQRNEAKLEFHMTEDDGKGNTLLDLAVGKYLDTSLIDADVQPTYVRVTVKGKLFQLCLPNEVSPDKSKAQRSSITGNLLITMPMINPGKLVAPPDYGSRGSSREGKTKNTLDDCGLGNSQSEAVDYRNIIENAGKRGGGGVKPLFSDKGRDLPPERPVSQNFKDNPDVPPLE